MKDVIFNNWQYKLLSLGFAIFFWYMVIGQQHSEITIEIPIEFQNVPENYVIVSNPVNKVSILLSGPSPIIKTLTKENLSFPVDLSKVKIGKNEIYLFPNMLNLPRKVTVKLINPSKFVIDIDKFEERILPVLPKFVGKVKTGYKIDSVNVNPPTVKIISLERELNKLDHVETDPINLLNKRTTFKVTVPVNVNIQYLKSVTPEKVTVTVKIVENLIDVTFKNIKLKVKTKLDLKSYKLKIIPSSITVKFKINSIMKKLVSKKDFEAYVNISSIGEQFYPVNIIPPSNVKIIDYSPKNVKIRFLKIKRHLK